MPDKYWWEQPTGPSEEGKGWPMPSDKAPPERKTVTPKIEIEISPDVVGTTVKIDGREVRHLKAFTLRCGVKEITTLTLELLATDGVKVEGQNVRIIENTQYPDPWRDKK